jgi:hypothetical protein
MTRAEKLEKEQQSRRSFDNCMSMAREARTREEFEEAVSAIGQHIETMWEEVRRQGSGDRKARMLAGMARKMDGSLILAAIRRGKDPFEGVFPTASPVGVE